jgi:hypothetical protein
LSITLTVLLVLFATTRLGLLSQFRSAAAIELGLAPPMPSPDEAEELAAEVSVGEPPPRECASRPRKSAVMTEIV